MGGILYKLIVSLIYLTEEKEEKENMHWMCIFIFSTKLNNSHASRTIHIIFPWPSTKLPDFSLTKLIRWLFLTFKVSGNPVPVGLCMQDYKCLCAAVMICCTLVNIQTHNSTQTAFNDQLTQQEALLTLTAVSYTHLTLPTKRIV